MHLANRTAIVTGGTKGIGLAIARALVAAGVNVSLSARSEDEVEQIAAELNKFGNPTDKATRRWLHHQHLFARRRQRASKHGCLQRVEVWSERF